MRVLRFEEIDSTSTYLKSYSSILPDLTFVVASYQSKGKGREERVWKANKGENLLFSLLIKNDPMLSCGPFLSLVSAVALSKVLEREFNIRASIKWPNDVYINDRKVAGILLEGKGSKCIVIGIGVNVNQLSFEGDYRIPPTSLYLETGKRIDIRALEDILFPQLLKELDVAGAKEAFLSYYQERDYLRGKTVSHHGEEYRVFGVNEDFDLLLEKEGKITAVRSGEISLL